MEFQYLHAIICDSWCHDRSDTPYMPWQQSQYLHAKVSLGDRRNIVFKQLHSLADSFGVIPVQIVQTHQKGQEQDQEDDTELEDVLQTHTKTSYCYFINRFPLSLSVEASVCHVWVAVTGIHQSLLSTFRTVRTEFSLGSFLFCCLQ